MNATVALIILQFIITMLFFPLRIGAKGHASLTRDSAELDLTFFGLAVARVRVKRINGVFKLYINGNMIKPKKKFGIKKVYSLAKQFKVQSVKVTGNLLALVGTDDARNRAIISSLVTGIIQPLFKTLKVFAARPTDALELDGKVTVQLTVLQLGALIASGIRW